MVTNAPLPLVSVVIPTHNRADLLPQAIDSVLSQDYPHVEIIVVDDGSTDDTAQIMQCYKPPVRYIQQANQGAAAARNRGIREASGEFIAFLDSDDWFLPGKLSLQAHYLLEHPQIGLVYSAYDVIDENRDLRWHVMPDLITGPHAYLDLLWRCMVGPITMPTVMLRRAIFDHITPFDETMRLAEDLDLWCRIARDYPIALLPESLSMVRIHYSSLTRRVNPADKLETWRKIVGKAFADDYPFPLFYKRRLYARIYYAAAVNAGLDGYQDHILPYLLRSLLWWPIPEYGIHDTWKYLTNPRKWRRLFQIIRRQ